MEEKEKTQEVPKGFYLADVPTNFEQTIVYEDKLVNVNQLVVAMANALKDNGILKLEL